jgi:hypothetical protein
LAQDFLLSAFLISKKPAGGRCQERFSSLLLTEAGDNDKRESSKEYRQIRFLLFTQIYAKFVTREGR